MSPPLLRCNIDGCGRWVLYTHASQHAWEAHHRAVDSTRLGPPTFTWQDTEEPPRFVTPGNYPMPARGHHR
jgi:hypothetical protein